MLIQVMTVDWPWQHDDKLGQRGAAAHYNTMPTEAAADFILPPHTDDCVMFFWRLGNMQADALAILAMWGFVPKSDLDWIKTTGACRKCGGKGYMIDDLPGATTKEWCVECEGRGGARWFGMGRYLRNEHETCIIATKHGVSVLPDYKSQRSTFTAPMIRGADGKWLHSYKPDAFYEIVEKMYPGRRYADIFARRRRQGWLCIGDQLPDQGAIRHGKEEMQVFAAAP